MVRNVGKGVSALAVDIYFSSFSSVTARIFCISQPERDLKEMNRSNTNNNIPTAPHALIIILGLDFLQLWLSLSTLIPLIPRRTIVTY